ncbi:hypothetical protein PM082_010020 [Marasmius tenuissimus]|nr:hypothetical protein PM082_010020 [Marasmius tenuissimus]
MYGYNLSANPSVLLHNELVPAAKLNAGIVGQMYLYSLHRQLGCEIEELWLDPGKGVFCCGPSGPYLDLGWRDIGVEELPLTAELVQEDVLLRFLASLKSKAVDDVVVGGVASSGALIWVSDRVLRPTVISTLTNTPIAVANNDAWRSVNDTLSDRKLLENGLTRFTPAGGGCVSLGWNWDAKEAWMAQAWSVFSARGISLDEDLSVFELSYPRAVLDGRLLYSEARHRSQQPIYFFIRPPLCNLDYGWTSSIHFWSFDEDGHSSLSDTLCNDFGLPTELRLSRDLYPRSWSNDAYSCIHQYQLLRGFDPSTTDFAQFLGYDENIYKPLTDSDRFMQVNQGSFRLFLLFASSDFKIPPQLTRLNSLTALSPPPPLILLNILGLAIVSSSLRATKIDLKVFKKTLTQLNWPVFASAASAQSAGFLSTLLSPLSSTLSSELDILTIGF